jgi:hypothetical protein
MVLWSEINSGLKLSLFGLVWFVEKKEVTGFSTKVISLAGW